MVDDNVKGMGEAMKQAAEGMALFAAEGQEAKVDETAAAAFKEEHEAAMKAKEDLVATLTGKDNKKQRSEVSKEISNMKADPKYVDACKIAKGLPPPKGNFLVTATEKPKAKETATEASADAAAPKKEAAEKKSAKKQDSAGLSRAEKDELEKLKTDIISKKAELKASGLSGGACNKDPDVVAMVNRMQELKIKEDPTLADAGKDKGKDKKKSKGALTESEQKELAKLEGEVEEYRLKLTKEFGYSKKDVAADPDFKEMNDRLAELKKRA